MTGYIFSIKTMQEIAKKVNGLPRLELLQRTYQEFLTCYPELILKDSMWTFNFAGGGIAEIKILYVSLNEYVVLWGSPIITMGHSGYYPKVDVYEIMLCGELRSYLPGGQVEIFRAGDVPLLKKGDRRYWYLSGNDGQGTYMIDYGRGKTLSLLKYISSVGHRFVTGDRQSNKDFLHEIIRSFRQHWNKRKIKKFYSKNNSDFYME